MYSTIFNTCLIIVLAPLFAGLVAGLAGKQLGRKTTHRLTIAAVGLSFILACYVAKWLIVDQYPEVNRTLYTWVLSGSFQFNIGFLVDRLSALMIVVVTFISLLVHIYSIGYMAKDPGYQRFFSYISLFTFAMLTLVLANNFLLLFFGWEAVGLVSYLLIGFWFKRETAAAGSLKAFLVNRVGDFGFLLGIAAVFNYFYSVDYATVFNTAPLLASHTMSVLPGTSWSVMTVMCLLLFIGAMGKSAQIPLHVWLPESMEGPTPISALIHAATMVTAGIYLLARLSPLFEYSTTALNVVLIVGASGALLLGILALVQQDIKRIIAYSTLSQLGYMVSALGASAYTASIFHLATHACFKALLFLAAGSVIVALHHEQDIRRMGGLRKFLPITYGTFLVGVLALAAIPPFSGFYSKDAIIEAIKQAQLPGAGYAYLCVLVGTFITALYSFRALFVVFHTQPRMEKKQQAELHEPSSTIWIPLLILAVPSVILGMLLVKPILSQGVGILGDSILVLPNHQTLNSHWDAMAMARHAIHTPPFWLAILGMLTAWLAYVKYPTFPQAFVKRFAWLYRILVAKYGFDHVNDWLFVKGTRRLAQWLYQVSDIRFIDNLLVNGSGRAIAWFSQATRRSQSGYLYHYALMMVVCLLLLSAWLILR